MKKISVKDLMVPIGEYAVVSEDATLSDAIRALERAQRAFDRTRHPHRAILVLDKANRPVGKISQLDALKAMEPKYKKIQGKDEKSAFRHFSRMFLHSMLAHQRLFDGSLDDLREKAARIRVKEFMSTVSEDDYLGENTTLDEALHILIMRRRQSLLVSRDNEIVGILRLTDVFAAAFGSLAAAGAREPV